MFEKAARMKLRFETAKGLLSVEELWDIPLISKSGKMINLDDIARGLHKQLKNDENVSFVISDRKSDTITQLKFDIVKHIIDVRLAENYARAKEQENAEKKQRLLELIADKEDSVLKEKSLEELQAMVKEL